MKKPILFTILIFATAIFSYSQNLYKWDRYSVSFKSPVALELYDAESEDVFGSQNDDYAVDISGFSLDYYNEYVKKGDIKSTAMQSAKDYGFTNVRDGGKVPGMPNGYYVISDNKTGNSVTDATVVVVIGVDEKKKHYIEGTIYCYNFNEDVGIQIAKTFAFY